MRRNWFTKVTSVFVATTHLMLSVFMIAPSIVQAQTVDIDPPVIELEVVNEGVRGETQVFSATVSDDNAISLMTMHYRFGSEAEYLSVPMMPIAGTSIYTTSVDTANASSDIIQYYLEARDEGGNRTVQGFAFDPFERLLLDDVAPVVAETVTTVPPVVAPAPRTSTSRKIVYGVLAALVVGGLVAASSSSGGGGGGGAEETDLTIIVDEF